MIFDEFRLLIQPDVTNPGVWSVHVQKSPLNQLTGPQGTLAPLVTSVDLSRLRNAAAPPDLAGLKQLGQRVLDTIMPAVVQFGFKLSIDQALQQQRGVRLVVSMLGNGRTLNGITALEVPLEAVFSAQLDFIASNVQTPVSRGVTVEADRNPVSVAPPLRILVVASEPADLPPVDAAAEKIAISESLRPLIQSRAVVLDFCDPPTLPQLNTRLQQEGYHVVHFIGHGDFDFAGLDPNPQPHLYFVGATPQARRHAVDGEQLYTVLRNGRVPLIVLTACSTAADSPNGQDYPVIAFASLAQGLVERQSGPLAAIAMQFDFETSAARVFSQALYERLLTPGWSVDQAVAFARATLIGAFGAGHRAWINPTVYWRCREGQVFEFTNSSGDLTPGQRSELVQIDAMIDVYATQIDELSHAPPQEQAAAAWLRAQWQAKIQELLTRRGLVLGDTVRLRGGTVAPDGTVDCVLTMQLRLPARLDDVRATIDFDSADFALIGSAVGQHVAPATLFVQANTGSPPVVLILDASQGAIWVPGEYELARLRFQVLNPASKPLFYIKLVDAAVNRDGAPQAFRTLDAVVFGV